VKTRAQTATIMDDRRHFATLILANQLGVLSKERVIAVADERIIELEKPEHWLIEVSIDGYSEDLGPLIRFADDTVYREALRIVFDAWVDGSITDQRFESSCEGLWKTAGYQSKWYRDLVWIGDEFDLVAQGIFKREDSIKRVRERIEKILE
jgi:hypothetical protein